MQAVLATPEGAVVREIPMPEPGAAQLLVQVHTAGLNRADLGTLTQAQGGVLGMEWAGQLEIRRVSMSTHNARICAWFGAQRKTSPATCVC